MKRNILLLSLSSVFVLLVTLSGNAAEWYEGGNLHKATVRMWRVASYDNRLATSADWFTGITRNENPALQKKLDNLNKDQWFLTLKECSKQLEICVSELAEEEKLFGPSGKVAEIAALCYIDMYITHEKKKAVVPKKPELENCKEHIELYSVKEWAKEYGESETWILQKRKLKINLWTKTTAQGKGKVCGKLLLGSRALILEQGDEDYKVKSPYDNSVGWLNIVQVKRTLFQDIETNKPCKGGLAMAPKPRKNIFHETGSTVKLFNPFDTTVEIHKDSTLSNVMNIFTNGISAMIVGSKKHPDKLTVYKVRILLKDGSKYIGWISENSISN